MTDWPHDDKFAFTGPLHGGGTATHDVYVKGTGPAILLLAGLTLGIVALAPFVGAAAIRLNLR